MHCIRLLTVRSGGATGIVVKRPSKNDTLIYCMKDKGSIRLIKFSLDEKLQRTEGYVNSYFLQMKILMNRIDSF